MISINMELCEVRIPTYRRPKLLKRALDSLVNQSHTNWIAIVMDDSPDQEGKQVVEEIKDQRIKYSPNSINLGCAENINQAFTSQSLMAGTYACILEDDNWLMPTFLAENIQSLKRSGLNLLLRNQEIWIQERQTSKQTNRTTRGNWFEQKIYTPLEIQAHLFYFEGISNGGLFWRTSIKSNLQVSNFVTDAGLQEYCRTLQVKDELLFEPIPLCFWSEMSSDLSLRNGVKNRVFGRGIQAIKRYLIKIYGEKIITKASEIGDRHNQQIIFEKALLDSLYFNYNFQYLSIAQRVNQYLKSYVKHKITPNPLHSYFYELRN